MLGNVSLFIAIAILIFTIYYAWWTKIRVVKLRQDIFDKRDELFDLAINVQASDVRTSCSRGSQWNALICKRDKGVSFLILGTLSIC